MLLLVGHVKQSNILLWRWCLWALSSGCNAGQTFSDALGVPRLRPCTEPCLFNISSMRWGELQTYYAARQKYDWLRQTGCPIPLDLVSNFAFHVKSVHFVRKSTDISGSGQMRNNRLSAIGTASWREPAMGRARLASLMELLMKS